MGAPTCRHRLEIAPRPEHRDPRGEAVAAWAARELGLAGLVVRTRDVYRVDADLDEAEARRVLAELVDPVTQAGALGRLELGDGPFDAVVTVGAKPGVTDPIGRSAKVAVEDTLGRALPPEAEVFSSVLYCFRGARREDAERIALGRLANPVVQSVKLETWR
jgi:phosphoribosylformylglycinamidine synthase